MQNNRLTNLLAIFLISVASLLHGNISNAKMMNIAESITPMGSAITYSTSQETEQTIKWKSSVKKVGENQFRLTFSGKIKDGWHTYSLSDEFSATEITFENDNNFFSLNGKPVEISKFRDEDGLRTIYNKFEFYQDIKLDVNSIKKAGASINEDGKQIIHITGEISWRGCTETSCASPEYYEFNLPINLTTVNSKEKPKSNGSPIITAKGGKATTVAAKLTKATKTDVSTKASSEIKVSETNIGAASSANIWALIIEAILWGFAMLLTPCVFPMIPMTISFFLKGSSTPAAGRFKAFMYGLFIVLLYTLPISIIIMLTRIIGGEAVTADIFNWLATHWIPNIIFFIIFMIFAASFFGAFEITLPSSIVNKSDKNADKKGLAGVFFMALTLVLVSFSCTGPIVGSVIIKSTHGEFWAPMVTMLAFSIAFALPFTLFAMFPSMLNKLKSGSWLNSVKVVLGFIEVALGFKFLSVPDLTYHWHLLDREVYLAIWIVVFTMLGFYLLGKIRFPHDEKVEKVGVFRIGMAIAVFTFVVYMIPGMFGAPLKALSGYMPPIETQDFVIPSKAELNRMTTIANTGSNNKSGQRLAESKYDITMPLGLSGYFTIKEGLEAAKVANKPIFVDITGHGCTNCREMEARVWSDPEVLNKLKENFIIVALYTDDKTRMDEEDWVTAPNGKVLKDMGRINSHTTRTLFNVNAQPNYVIISPEGEQLVPVRGYNLSIPGFLDFLDSGIAAYKANL